MTSDHDESGGMRARPDQLRTQAAGGAAKSWPGGRPVSATAGQSSVQSWSNASPYAQMLAEMRQSRRRRFFVRLGLFVGLPTLAVFVYVFFLASPRYTSAFEATYQTYRSPESLSAGIVQSFAGTSENNSIDPGSILYEYIRSPSLMMKLDRDLHLKSYYSNPHIDYFSRLSKNASNESFLTYYRRRVSVSEGFGGYVTVHVEAFDSKYASDLAREIVAACDAMMDKLTTQARSDEIKVAQDQVAQEEARVQRSRQALAEFQNAYGDQDPNRMATQLGDIVGKLETDLAATRAQLAQAQQYLAPTSPVVSQLKTRVRALEQQLQQEQSRLANNGGTTPFSTILERYSALQMEQEFAKTAYLAAEQGLAVARADAARKQSYLVDFAPPTEPDRPSRYFPLVYTLSTFLGSLLIFAFGSLVVGAFRDQAGI